MPQSGTLTFEETLQALQGFIGERVAVMVSGTETRWHPIAFFRDVIARATTMAIGSYEAIMFRFGGEEGARGDTGFFINSARFHSATWDEDLRELTVVTADGVIRVFADADISIGERARW